MFLGVATPAPQRQETARLGNFPTCSGGRGALRLEKGPRVATRAYHVAGSASFNSNPTAAGPRGSLGFGEEIAETSCRLFSVYDVLPVKYAKVQLRLVPTACPASLV